MLIGAKNIIFALKPIAFEKFVCYNVWCGDFASQNLSRFSKGVGFRLAKAI